MHVANVQQRQIPRYSLGIWVSTPQNLASEGCCVSPNIILAKHAKVKVRGCFANGFDKRCNCFFSASVYNVILINVLIQKGV